MQKVWDKDQEITPESCQPTCARPDDGNTGDPKFLGGRHWRFLRRCLGLLCKAQTEQGIAGRA